VQLPLQELLRLLVLQREVQLWEGLDGVDLLGDGFIFQESFFVSALEEMREAVAGWASTDAFWGTGQVRLASRALGRMLCPPSFLRVTLHPFCCGKGSRRQQKWQSQGDPGAALAGNRIMELLRLEKPSKIIKSNLQPKTTTPAKHPSLQPHVHPQTGCVPSFGRAERLKNLSQGGWEPPGAGTGNPVPRQPPAAAAHA